MLAIQLSQLDDDLVQIRDGEMAPPAGGEGPPERGKVIVIPDPATGIPVVISLTAAQAHRWGAELQGKRPLEVYGAIPGSGNANGAKT